MATPGRTTRSGYRRARRSGAGVSRENGVTTRATMLQAVTAAFSLVFIAACVLSLVPGPLGAQETAFELRIDAPLSVTAGERFDVTLRGSSSLDLLGYAAHLTYDPAVLSVVSSAEDAFFSGTVWEEADFLIAKDDPTSGALVVGVILDQDQEGGGRVVAAGGDLHFLNLAFEAAEVESATTTTIDFSGDIDGNLLADIELAGHDAASGLTLSPATIDVVLPGGVLFLRGDCNGDGEVTGAVADAVFLLSFSFMGGAEPPCLAACDANGDGDVVGHVSDAVYILLFNFMGGPPPAAPFPDCGPGELPGDGELGCEISTEACA